MGDDHPADSVYFLDKRARQLVQPTSAKMAVIGWHGRLEATRRWRNSRSWRRLWLVSIWYRCCFLSWFAGCL